MNVEQSNQFSIIYDTWQENIFRKNNNSMQAKIEREQVAVNCKFYIICIT